MRTTLTIDDDLMAALQEEARRRRTSFREVVNKSLRAGLGGTPKKKSRAVVRVYESKLRSGFDPAGFNKLVDELEDEALSARLKADE
jgi:Ribbon-helix-helix protein, copG family